MNKVNPKDRRKIKSWVRKCMNLLKKKDYPLNITRSDVDYAVKVTRVVNKNFEGATYGGLYQIQINLNYWQHRNGAGIEEEYAAFANNPVYGDRQVTDVDDRLLITVAHEVAHHVQYRIMQADHRIKRSVWKKPHGDGFQRIYRWLRQDLVNPIIDAKIAEQDKLNQLKKITRRRQMDLPMHGEEFKLVA
tara:strand:+ start:1056 stop:1625 length:570 start_codon:yes stop_codon:yes gene_type:complete